MSEPFRIIAPLLSDPAVRRAIVANGIPVIVCRCVHCGGEVGTAASSQPHIKAGAEIWCMPCAEADGWKRPTVDGPVLMFDGAFVERLRAMTFKDRCYFIPRGGGRPKQLVEIVPSQLRDLLLENALKCRDYFVP